jgi:signal transduction histidine kinase
MSNQFRANILIVEDETIIAMDIRQHLLQHGYGVTGIADCAKTALESVSTFQPDLVLMDIHLPGETNGIKAAEQIREKFHVPIIFLTSYCESVVFEQAKMTNPLGYIVKPFQPQTLKATIDIALSQYRAEVATQQAIAEAKELNEMKSQFISLVSHEFRNPLSAILMSLELLEHQHSLQLSPEKHHVYIQRARSAVTSMGQLIEEVLAIGELEAGKLQFHPRPFDLVLLCQELVEQFQNESGRNHVLLFNVKEQVVTEDGLFDLDEKLLRHILTNLLSNAVKYSASGSVIQFEISRLEANVVFRIQDQGIGIPLPDQARLFEFFHRGENVKTVRGTGLGLAIAKQCVEAHGGTITFESEVGAGTAFTVTLFHSRWQRSTASYRTNDALKMPIKTPPLSLKMLQI